MLPERARRSAAMGLKVKVLVDRDASTPRGQVIMVLLETLSILLKFRGHRGTYRVKRLCKNT